MSDRLDLPEIVTARLRLRILDRDEADDLRRLTDDPVILGAVHFLPDPFRLGDAAALIAGAGDGRDRFLGGRLVFDGTLAVVCGAHLQGEDKVEIGYWVGTAHAGRGLAFEAAHALLSALRTTVPHRKPVAECRRENTASWHLLHKLGFRPTGEPGKRPGRVRLAASIKAP